MSVVRVVAAIAALCCACSCSNKPAVTQQPWFTDIAASSGLHFTHASGASGKFHMPEIMGSGCALLDYDNDGDLDILLVQGDGGAHRFFRNDGNLRFTDVTAQAGIVSTGAHGMGAATADFNNDGYTDLLITAAGSNALYRNNGHGAFTNVTAESPEIELKNNWSTSAAFFDYDRDGWQDLVILNYIDYSPKACYAPTGELDYCTPRVYQPVPARLFHNEKGHFKEIRNAFAAARGPGLGVVPIDANNDGFPDVFVANDSMANHLWINRGGKFFEENALQTGTAYGEEGLAKAGMGIAAGDYDNDGDEDLLVLNLMREGATLFRNDGGSKGFTDVAQASGIHALTHPWTGFGTAFHDFDRDGLLDLFIANGSVTRREEQRGKPYPFEERNLLLKQTGNGKFEEIANPSDPPGVSRGAAFGDLDGDGDIDILVNVNNAPARLLRNDTPPQQWIAVDTSGAFAKVEIKATGMPVQTRWVRTSGSYLSASDSRVYFGLGSARSIEYARVTFANGKTWETRGPSPNQVIKGIPKL